MNTTFKIILVSLLCIMFLGVVQTNAFQNQVPSLITIQFDDLSLNSAISLLEKECGFSIAYQDTIVDTTAIINQKFENKTIDQIMDVLLENTNYDYAIIYYWIIIYLKKEKSAITVNNQVCLQSFTTGKVVHEDGRPVNDASVYLKGEGFVAHSRFDGSFVVPTTVPDAEIIVFYYMGHFPCVVRVCDAGLVKMQPNYKVLNEVITAGPPLKKEYYTVENNWKSKGIAFVPHKQYTAKFFNPVIYTSSVGTPVPVAYASADYACDNKSCPLGKLMVECTLTHIDGQCEIYIYNPSISNDNRIIRNNSDLLNRPTYSSYVKIKRELKYGGDFGFPTEQEIEDMNFMFHHYSQKRAKSFFNSEYMLCYPFNMEGMRHKNDFTCGRVIVTGKNGIDFFVYFIMTDKGLSNFDNYLSDFSKTLWFED